MKKIYISDLKVGDSLFGEVFAVRSYVKKASRNNKPYIDIELADRTGVIRGKIWSDDMPNTNTVGDGDVVLVNATVDEYMGTPQINVTNMSKTEKFELEDLQQRSKFETEKMWSDVEETIEKIKNPHLKKLLNNVFSDKETLSRYKFGPGAYTVHHNYVSGLLEHSWEIMKLARNLKEQYPKLNMDLVNTGVILHDIGKAYEFDLTTTVVFRNEGKLLGHVFLGAEKVKEFAPENMPEDLLDEVLHIILSHHGAIEFGAAVVPKTAEAMAVHLLDNTSSKLNIAYEAIQGSEGTEQFTPYLRHLGTEMYRSPYLEEEINEDIPF